MLGGVPTGKSSDKFELSAFDPCLAMQLAGAKAEGDGWVSSRSFERKKHRFHRAINGYLTAELWPA